MKRAIAILEKGGLYTLTETGAPVSRVYLGESYEAGQGIFESFI